MKSIRDEIVEHRRQRVQHEGHELGCQVPAEREVPLSPFLAEPRLICEVKRRSPSRGDIAPALDPVELAGTYAGRGVRTVSVLTEENYFHGTLDDLMSIKRAHPELALLRKDFLLDLEDIRVSHRAGADAVLLIASILSGDELAELAAEADRLGMAALVELHDEEDVRKAKAVRPRYVGINSRNLSTFEVDLLAPLALQSRLDWEHTAVFESGIYSREDARLVATSGFNAILVGESVVRDATRISGIVAGLTQPQSGPATMAPNPDFWSRVAAAARSRSGPGPLGGQADSPRSRRRPLVKICGITNRPDAEAAVRLGADLLGFVFADSPRRATAGLVRALADLDVPMVAVVVSGGRHGPPPREVLDLLGEGLLDAVQFHGDEEPAECADVAYPYYRAIRISSDEDIAEIRRFACPRVLVDARVPGSYGGTGKQISHPLLDSVSEHGPLWVAGGLHDGNIAELVRRFRPELVDASSGLEAEPGRKDHGKLRRFFEEIDNA